MVHTGNKLNPVLTYGQQVKPCFDVDAYNQDIDIDEIIAKINAMFPNKKVIPLKENPDNVKTMD